MAKQKPQFRVMKNGYDRFAVDDAINDYHSELEKLEKQVELYKKQLDTSQEQLNQLKVRYKTLVSELSVKEKAADDIARLALKEANAIIDTAQNNANAIVKEALSTARIVLVELSQLSKSATGFKEDMKAQLETLMKNIDEFEFPSVPDINWLKEKKNEKQ